MFDLYGLTLVFFDPKRWDFLIRSEKWKIWDLLGEIFQIQRWLTRPDPTRPMHQKLIRSDLGQKILTRTHQYSIVMYIIYLSIYIYINGRTDVCLFVCLLVCGGLMEIQTPASISMKFSIHIPTCPRKVLVQIWPPPPHLLGLGAQNPISWRTHF